MRKGQRSGRDIAADSLWCERPHIVELALSCVGDMRTALIGESFIGSPWRRFAAVLPRDAAPIRIGSRPLIRCHFSFCEAAFNHKSRCKREFPSLPVFSEIDRERIETVTNVLTDDLGGIQCLLKHASVGMA